MIILWSFICPDKTVDESVDAGAEMTEEEWNLRVAELNKHQVCIEVELEFLYLHRVKSIHRNKKKEIPLYAGRGKGLAGLLITST